MVCHLTTHFSLLKAKNYFSRVQKKNEIKCERSTVCFYPCLMPCMVSFRNLKDTRSERLPHGNKKFNLLELIVLAKDSSSV